MKNVLTLLVAIAVSTAANCLTSQAGADTPTRPGKLPMVIVYAVNAIELEKEAADELKTYLTKISGVNYSLQAEDKALDGASAIYVGQTVFARNSGLDFGEFAEEEYILRTVGSNLIIGGGQPNGTLNGVNHLLSRELGCRFFTWDCKLIPHQENLKMPVLDIRRKPSFAGRCIYMSYYPPPAYFTDTPEGLKETREYLRRNFSNASSSSYGRQSLNPDATQCHNLYFWVDPRKYSTTNPEFFSNKTFNQSLWPRNQEGNLCWTNRRIWEITLDRLRECIEKDRAELPKWKWPVTYQISQNDIQEYCQCANCKAAVKAAGGTQAGPLLQYVNFVAESIAREFPDVNIMTFAYVDSEMPPANIRPASNVIIQWCDLYTRSDCYRPLSHEFNAGQVAILDGWKKLGAKFAVWDYWNMGHALAGYFDPPRIETMVDAIAPDLRYFAASGVDSLMLEAEPCKSNPQNFMDLQYYLGYQLMMDVTLPEETLIKEYLAGCYGPAAPAMEEFLTLLRYSVQNEKKPLFYILNQVRTYTDGAFLEKVYNLLKKARADVPTGSDYYRRIQQEMITPLAVILQNPQYDFFQRTGLTKEYLVAEYRTVRLSRIELPWLSAGRQKQDKTQLEKDIAGMLLDIPVPDHLKHYKQIRKFAYPYMDNNDRLTGSIEPDPDSPVGMAMVSRGKAGQEEAQHDLKKSFAGGYYPNSFGIYSRSDKRSASTIQTDVPQDEKYHWYKINAFDFGPNTYLWGFYWRFNVNLSSAYTTADGLPGCNIWESWISVKYTGPAYVKGSKQKNGVFLDRVILVKPEDSKK